MTDWNGTDESVTKKQGAVYSVEEYSGELQNGEIKM